MTFIITFLKVVWLVICCMGFTPLFIPATLIAYKLGYLDLE